jgi:hypothetical protein
MSYFLSFAQDPNSTPALFEMISSCADPQVLCALAKNPNTPAKILFRLAERFPSEFLHNPVLPLLLLENPLFFREMTHPQLSAIIFRAEFPRELLLDLCQHPQRGISLMAHRALCQHPATPASELAACKSGGNEVRRALAVASNTDAELLRELLCDSDAEVRRRASRHKNAPQDVLLLLRRAGATEDLLDFATPQSLSRAQHEQLQELGPFARALWVRHPRTTLDAAVVSSVDPWWLAALVSRLDLPDEVLAQVRKFSFPCVEREFTRRLKRQKESRPSLRGGSRGRCSSSFAGRAR